MRRVVTGTDASGRSTVVRDGLPQLLFHFRDQSGPHQARAEPISDLPDKLVPGEGVLAELWSTDDPHSTAPEGDTSANMTGWNVECPPGATRFRTSLFSAGRTTAMHTTNTIDYDFILDGSMTLILSDGSETELSPGDAVIIPGVAHAWRAGPDGCRLGLVMVGLPEQADQEPANHESL